MTTPQLSIGEIAVNQATKYTTANTAFRVLEQFAGGGRVISRTTSAEPGSPSDGDAYILPASPTGTNWASYSQHDLVIYISSSWHVVTPFDGLGPFWVTDANEAVYYDGSAWSDYIAGGLGNGLEDLTTAEVDQLENIDSVTISNAQWGYLGALDQAGATTDDVQFNSVNFGNENLDEYDEGTFTPELWDNTLATEGTPPTYTNQIGHYRRIGNKVTITIRLTVSALGGLTTTEAARIGGLPFTVANIGNSAEAVHVGLQQSMSLGGNYSVKGYINNNTSYITLRVTDNTSGGTNLLISEFGSTGDISINATYLLD